MSRSFVTSEMFSAVVDKGIFGQRGIAANNDSNDRFTAFFIGYADNANLDDVRVMGNDILDLVGIDVEA